MPARRRYICGAGNIRPFGVVFSGGGELARGTRAPASPRRAPRHLLVPDRARSTVRPQQSRRAFKCRQWRGHARTAAQRVWCAARARPDRGGRTTFITPWAFAAGSAPAAPRMLTRARVPRPLLLAGPGCSELRRTTDARGCTRTHHRSRRCRVVRDLIRGRPASGRPRIVVSSSATFLLVAL